MVASLALPTITYFVQCMGFRVGSGNARLGGSQERAESGTLLIMFMVKLSAPLVAAMKALRNTSGVKKP